MHTDYNFNAELQFYYGLLIVLIAQLKNIRSTF